MGRRARNPEVLVTPVSSKKQLLGKAAVCTFLGGISDKSLERLRSDLEIHFPQPIQMLGQTPLWSVEQLERFVMRMEKKVEALSA